jgi:hypothetical protein
MESGGRKQCLVYGNPPLAEAQRRWPRPDAINPARVAAVTITSAVASGNTRPPTAPHRPLHARAEQDVLPRDFDEDELTPRQRGGQSRMENLSLLSKHTNCLNWIT